MVLVTTHLYKIIKNKGYEKKHFEHYESCLDFLSFFKRGVSAV